MADPCSTPVLGHLCDAVGGAVGAAATSAFDAMAKRIAEGLADATKTVLTFWTNVKLPNLSVQEGPVAVLRELTYPLVALIATGALLVAAGRMALTRSGQPAEQAGKGLLTLIVASGAGVAVVSLLARAGDEYSVWILDRSADGDLGARLAQMAALSSTSGIGPGLMFVVALCGILASLAQMALMIFRVGVVTIFAGILPLTAAASSTDRGREWFQRVVTWLLAFILYKPAAATVYASAFLLVGDGQDSASVLSGLFLMMLSIVALPALLRLLAPGVSAATSSSGGAAAAAAVTAVATGARMLPAGGSGRGAAPAQGPHTPGLRGGDGSSGASGPTGGTGTSGGSGPAGRSGAAGRPGSSAAPTGAGAGAGAGGAAGGAAGPLVVVGAAAQAAGAATSGARSAVQSTDPGPGGGSGVNGSNGSSGSGGGRR